MLSVFSRVGPPDLVDKAIRLGMPAIALTDHGCMYGIKEFLDSAKKTNKKLKEEAAKNGTDFVPFKPIVGVEAYCARRGRKDRDKDLKAISPEGKQYIVDQSGWHLILLAKNKTGYHNLCKIVSESFMDDCYYRRPRIDKALLEEFHEGIICSSACLGGEISQKVMEGLLVPADVAFEERFKSAIEAAQWFKNLFGEDYYIELQRHQTDKEGADQMVYQSEKTMEEMGDKIDAADKTELQGKIDALKEALKGEDIEAIKAKQEELTKTFYAISEKLYQQQAPQGDPNAAQGDPNGGQQYYDADYKVVDEDENK